ncbi:octopamine receptor Oamb-like [Diaphorina citri]|uniref:Octopamine receptor Oamb-like n=1 Tax=Diaphorina citri TaxID=121845 RepID=A0A1S4ELW6_DIACI|nr:octopamine receptor Oamb-like [Diaphorina citri]
MVGVAVLPFSSTWQVYEVWIFGGLWCKGWLAVDVWMCTASILNLCAISLDRYIAVTRPVKYPSIMSMGRAKLLICFVWVLSFSICFPPLIGFVAGSINQRQSLNGSVTVGNFTGIGGGRSGISIGGRNVSTFVGRVEHTTGAADGFGKGYSDASEGYSESGLEGDYNNSLLITRTLIDTPDGLDSKDFYNGTIGHVMRRDTRTQGLYSNHSYVESSRSDPCKCELNDDPNYVVYSAMGSFFIPMFVMLFFYWRIYKAAVRTTKAINQGFRTTKSGASSKFGNRFDDQRLTLRIHRGRGSSMKNNSTLNIYSSSNNTSTDNSTCNSLTNSPGGYKNSNSNLFKTKEDKLYRTQTMKKYNASPQHDKVKISISYPSSDCISNLNSSPSNTTATNSSTTQLFSDDTHLRVNSKNRNNSVKNSYRRNSDIPQTNTNNSVLVATLNRPKMLGENLTTSHIVKDTSPTYEDQSSGNKPKLINKMGKRNIKAQVKRFRMETKAAKTLAIIVGGFAATNRSSSTRWIGSQFAESTDDVTHDEEPKGVAMMAIYCMKQFMAFNVDVENKEANV